MSNNATPVPGGPKSALRRRANQERQAEKANERPASTRSAGAGGSSSTMLKLYTDEASGLRVDPIVVMVMALGFIFSVVALHVLAKISNKFFVSNQ
ncbi:protein transport protein Sbh2p [Trichomonascus vanleenenianus]|uniref:Arf family guanine nucleotide exchange factor SBH2 n=1 Tax=Trichomonascus vanleenenianus TaxID=2268995 RepID=UPI003ECA7A52